MTVGSSITKVRQCQLRMHLTAEMHLAVIICLPGFAAHQTKQTNRLTNLELNRQKSDELHYQRPKISKSQPVKVQKGRSWQKENKNEVQKKTNRVSEADMIDWKAYLLVSCVKTNVEHWGVPSWPLKSIYLEKQKKKY